MTILLKIMLSKKYVIIYDIKMHYLDFQSFPEHFHFLKFHLKIGSFWIKSQFRTIMTHMAWNQVIPGEHLCKLVDEKTYFQALYNKKVVRGLFKIIATRNENSSSPVQ